MKITIEHKETKVILEESENFDKYKVTSMSYSDQNEKIQDTIKVIFNEVRKINEVPEEK